VNSHEITLEISRTPQSKSNALQESVSEIKVLGWASADQCDQFGVFTGAMLRDDGLRIQVRAGRGESTETCVQDNGDNLDRVLGGV